RDTSLAPPPPRVRARRGRGTVGVDEVEPRRQVEVLLDALGEAIELVVTVRVVVAHLERFAEVRQRVDAVGGVGGAERVDRVQHLAPGGEPSLEDEIGLGGHALAHRDAIEDLERQRGLERRLPVGVEHADGEGGIEEAQPAEALPGSAHLVPERFEEIERREANRHGTSTCRRARESSLRLVLPPRVCQTCARVLQWSPPGGRRTPDFFPPGRPSMAYIITRLCRDCLDTGCVAVCPVDCIYEYTGSDREKFPNQLYIHPDECIDCGACEPECPWQAIFEEVAVPDVFKDDTPLNYAIMEGMDDFKVAQNK